LYIGFTEDLKQRFLDHNSGKNLSTKNRRPFELIFMKPSQQIDALRRESYFKTRKGKTTLKIMLKNFWNNDEQSSTKIFLPFAKKLIFDFLVDRGKYKSSDEGITYGEIASGWRILC